MDKSKFEIYKSKLTELKRLLDGDLMLVSLSAWCEANGLDGKVGLLLSTVINNSGTEDDPFYEWLSGITIDEVVYELLRNDKNDNKLPYGGADNKIIELLKKNDATERDYKIFMYLQMLKDEANGDPDFVLDNFFNKHDVHDHIRKLIIQNYIKNVGTKDDPTWLWDIQPPTLGMAKNLANHISNASIQSKVESNNIETSNEISKIEHQYLSHLIDIQAMAKTGKMKDYKDFIKQTGMANTTIQAILSECMVRHSVKNVVRYEWILGDPDIKLVRKLLQMAGLDYSSNIAINTLDTDKNLKHSDEIIYIENDYEKFTFFPMNRDIDMGNFKSLLESVRVWGYTNGSAILVWHNPIDGLFYIIEGQHRFRVCKFLGMGIKYTIENCDRQHAEDLIPVLNNSQKKWTIRDRIYSFAEIGLSEYIKAKKTDIIYKNLSLGNILLIATNHINSGSAVDDNFIKNGRLKFKDDMDNRLRYLDEISKRLTFTPDSSFVRILAHLFDIKLEKEHMDRLLEKAADIIKLKSTADYAIQFQDLMNKNKRQENHISLT